MKKIIIILVLLSFNLFGWQTFTTDAGGVGIRQNGVTGAKNAKLEIFKQNDKYKVLFTSLTNKLFFYETGFGERCDMDIINDLGKGENTIILGFPITENSTQFGIGEGFVNYLTSSKWIKLSVPVGDGTKKVFKFDMVGLEKAISKIEE